MKFVLAARIRLLILFKISFKISYISSFQFSHIHLTLLNNSSQFSHIFSISSSIEMGWRQRHSSTTKHFCYGIPILQLSKSISAICMISIKIRFIIHLSSLKNATQFWIKRSGC
eukprot:Pompholyxophrys_punicea_v1_NODE_38_length_4733_cov_3.558572.p7 type:complete len:114 gc:universal NODE_38_length_4733_cov_3.558572:2737-3078(+)